MTRFGKSAVWIAVLGFLAPACGAEEPMKAVVEFRWLSDKPVKELTEEKGIQTTCYPDLMYQYLKPALTNADVESVQLKEHDFTRNGLSVLYTIDFRLKGDARKKLAKDAGDREIMQLATFVDGKYWGTGIIRKGGTEKFSPSAGFISSKTEAERIAKSFDK